MKIEINLQIKSMEMGQLLKLRRKEKGMYQTQLAKKLGVSNSSIGHKESGIRGFELDFLKKWCDILGLEIEISLKEKSAKRK